MIHDDWNFVYKISLDTTSLIKKVIVYLYNSKVCCCLKKNELEDNLLDSINVERDDMVYNNPVYCEPPIQINFIKYTTWIPDRTEIYFYKKSNILINEYNLSKSILYKGIVIDDRKYPPRYLEEYDYNQRGYVHNTAVKLDDGTVEFLYYEVYEDKQIPIKSGNCIIVNPFIN